MIKITIKKGIEECEEHIYIYIYTSNEKLESNSSAESEEKRRYGIIVADYFCDRRHGNVIHSR